MCQFQIPCCSFCAYFRHVSLHLLHFIVLWDKSKFRKEISGSATHYFLEWNHLSCFLPHLFLPFFTPFWYFWTIIVKQNEKVNATQESREIKYHDWHCKTPNNLNMPLLHGMQYLFCDWNWRPNLVGLIHHSIFSLIFFPEKIHVQNYDATSINFQHHKGHFNDTKKVSS